MQLQPRKTKCYGHAYAYSGQTHPLEPETPPAISLLYEEVNAIFGLPQDGMGGVNMCLENDYANGRHYISEHSDDERSFGTIDDVFCFITGPAEREGIFRFRKDGKRSPAEREVVRIRLPAGLYVMCGRRFQAHYSHEFPQLHEELFKRLCKRGPSVWPEEFPVEVPAHGPSGLQQTSLVQAAWLQHEHERVAQAIEAGKFVPKQKSRALSSAVEDGTNFANWLLWRTSYTLRNFDSPEIWKERMLKRAKIEEN
jgi:hypothetical protein